MEGFVLDFKLKMPHKKTGYVRGQWLNILLHTLYLDLDYFTELTIMNNDAKLNKPKT